MGKLIKDDQVDIVPGRQFKKGTWYCLWGRHMPKTVAALSLANNPGHEVWERHWQHGEKSEQEVNGWAEVLEGLSSQNTGEPTWVWVTPSKSCWGTDTILLGLHSRSSLDSHPRAVFFKCLYIIIKKDKENKVRGHKQYWWVPNLASFIKITFCEVCVILSTCFVVAAVSYLKGEKAL